MNEARSGQGRIVARHIEQAPFAAVGADAPYGDRRAPSLVQVGAHGFAPSADDRGDVADAASMNPGSALRASPRPRA